MAESNALIEKRDLFHAKQRELGEVFTLAKDGNAYDFSRATVLEKLGASDSIDAVSKVKSRNVELEALNLELQTAEVKAVEEAVSQRETARRTPVNGPTHHSVRGDGYKSFGELFTESKAYANYKSGKHIGQPATIEMSLKTLFETGAGFAPESVRSGRIVEAVTRPIQVLDLIPSAPISQAAEKYMEETTRTHSGVEKAEGAAYPESAFAFTERTSDVRKIADSIPVTDEQLEDELQVRSLLDQRLRFGLRQRMDLQVLVGDGTPPNLSGILDRALSTQAKGADPVFDAVYKAITKVRFTGRAVPNALVFHPNDWQDIRLTRTADGQYIMGNPSQPGPMTLFGLPVAISDGLTENTGLVGDFANFCRIGERRGVEVQVGYVNTQFTDGKLTLRADLRACFTVYRPTAFCSITGI